MCEAQVPSLTLHVTPALLKHHQVWSKRSKQKKHCKSPKYTGKFEQKLTGQAFAESKCNTLKLFYKANKDGGESNKKSTKYVIYGQS